MTDDEIFCLRRRDVLFAGAGGIAMSIVLPGVLEAATGEPARVDLALYPEKRVGQLSQLTEGEPVAFTYPLEGMAALRSGMSVLLPPKFSTGRSVRPFAG